MRQKEILICEAEGGSVNLMKENDHYYFSSDGITLSEFVDDLDSKSLKSESEKFPSFDLALQSLLDKFNIFSLYPEKINPIYSTHIKKAFFERASNDNVSMGWLNKLFNYDMFYSKYVNLNIKSIERASKNVFANLEKDNYLTCYQNFVDFLRKGELDLDKFIVGTNMIYGRSPTILNLDLSNISKIEQVLKKLNKKEKLGLWDFETLKRSINNSLVGMSRFLHFVNPYSYPMIGPKVYQFITGNKFSAGLDRSIAYVAYIKKMNDVIQDKNVNSILSFVRESLDAKLSPMRCLELIMFYSK